MEQLVPGRGDARYDPQTLRNFMGIDLIRQSVARHNADGRRKGVGPGLPAGGGIDCANGKGQLMIGRHR